MGRYPFRLGKHIFPLRKGYLSESERYAFRNRLIIGIAAAYIFLGAKYFAFCSLNRNFAFETIIHSNQTMAINNMVETHRQGRIEVVCGSMFSGKTEELLRRMKRAKFARQRVEIFKPSVDTRYSEEEVVSHDHNAIISTPVDSSASILLLSSEIDVVGIDEAQFFDDGLVDVCNELAYRGVRVIVAGLDMDFKGQPFGPMPAICAIADEVSKVHAICVRCGSLAYVSHRLVENDRRVLLGETNEYEPLCRECYRQLSTNTKKTEENQ